MYSRVDGRKTTIEQGTEMHRNSLQIVETASGIITGLMYIFLRATCQRLDGI